MPKYGKIYECWVGGEPYPKSTKKPPRAKNPAAVWAIVHKYDGYKRLAKTWDWQSAVASAIRDDNGFPTFDKRDPLRLSLHIYSETVKRGDLKNIIASVEDGLKRSGKIPDDRYIESYGEVRTYPYSETPGVKIVITIDDVVMEEEIFRKMKRMSKRALVEYYRERGVDIA